jgi:hypothetical protein
MPRRKHKPIAVQPPRFGWVITQHLPEKNGSDFGATQGQTKVTGGTSVDGIHGQTTGFISCTLQRISWKIHSF